MQISTGQLLAGKYRVERVLGQGGMGVVVAAHHLVLDQVVAIKLLLPEALGSAAAVARFEREARAAVKIQSEHVARVMDVGRLENGSPYMVMELLRGRDLAMLIRERGPLPLADVADYLLQAGEAIAEAHSLGIVHRDLKPANLYLTVRADGSSCVKVLDFGISKLTVPGSDAQGMTSTAAIMGSPLYMSPEQLMSARDVDMRTDIWSLGVIGFELLTGKPPFQAETLPQLCMAIQLSPPTPVRNFRPDLPPEVDAMLLRCLTKDPAQRYATVAELAAELVKFAPKQARLSAERIDRLSRAAGFSTSDLALPPSSRSTAASAEAQLGDRTLAEFGRTKPGSSSSKLRLGLGLLTLLILGTTGVFVRSRQAPPNPASVPSSTLNASRPADSSASIVLAEPAISAELAAPAESAAPTGSVIPALSAAPKATPVVAPIPQPASQPSTHGVPSAAPVPHKPVVVNVKPITVPTASATAAVKPTANPNPSSPKTQSLGGRL